MNYLLENNEIDAWYVVCKMRRYLFFYNSCKATIKISNFTLLVYFVYYCLYNMYILYKADYLN